MRPGRVVRVVAGSLGPGALADALAALPVVVDEVAVETRSVEVPGYYGGAPRPSGVVTLVGGGVVGRGENVGWTPADQARFAAVAPGLVPAGRTTIGALSDRLRRRWAEPYHRAAVEGAAIDLALRQAATNPFVLSGRPPSPVAFCRSLNETADPVTSVAAVIEADPGARIKVDCPPEGWPEATWKALAATGRVVVVDFKRSGASERVVEAHRHVPAAWLEDPPVEALALPARDARWTARISLDGHVSGAADLEWPPLPPAAVNVKAPRVGGWLEALACLEGCRRRGWATYVGGMFEVSVGRAQARVLASLYCPDAWNDLAPLAGGADGAGSSPLAITDDFVGFAPGDAP